MEQIRVDCISSEQYGELGEDLIEHAVTPHIVITDTKCNSDAKCNNFCHKM